MSAGPTLRSVLEDPALRLEILTGQRSLARPLRWAHASELSDPTPYLEGGELLLTTGLGLAGEDLDAYVDRLVTRGVAALGFGVGVAHESVPAGLLAAALRTGLPLVLVPRPTPFVAVAKAVSAAIVDAAAAEERAVAEAQRRLVRVAAGADGAAGLVRTLARAVDGSAAMLGPDRAVLQAFPPDSTPSVDPLDLRRLGSRPPPTSARIESEGSDLVLHSLGVGRLRGYLVVCTTRRMVHEHRRLIANAAALATLLLERPFPDVATPGPAAVLRILLAGEPDLAAGVAADLGVVLPPPPWRVAVLVGDGAARQLVQEWAGPAALVVEQPERVVVILPGDARPSGVGQCGGLSRVVDPPDVRAAVAEAAGAARTAVAAGGSRMLLAEDLPALGTWLSPGDLAAFASVRLAPLLGSADPTLLESVRAWLAHHGQYDPAAVALGVHRHTLRRRIRRAAELLGADLDDPGVRAELWIAVSGQVDAGSAGVQQAARPRS